MPPLAGLIEHLARLTHCHQFQLLLSLDPLWHVIGARMASMVYGKEDKAKAVPAIIKSVLDTFDPLGKDENMVAQFTPTIGKPFVHIYTNKNWTGKPLSPEPMPWNKSDPDSSRFFRNASPFSVATAQKLNEITGGSKRESGLVDWSPATIDYMLGVVTGGLGRFAKNTFESGIYRPYNGMEWESEKTPIVRRFYGEKNEHADQAIYFEEREKVQAAKQRVDNLIKDGDGKNAARLRREQAAEYASADAFENADERRKTIRKEVDRLNADKSLSPAEREKRIKAQEQLELVAMRQARKVLDQARKRRQANAPGQ